MFLEIVKPILAEFNFYSRRQIVKLTTADDTPFSKEIETNESYFGGVRKYKRGRGAAGTVPVFAS